jgi:hypothetical protein
MLRGKGLLFARTGELVNFESDDRARSESDGTFTPPRFSSLCATKEPLHRIVDFQCERCRLLSNVAFDVRLGE